MTLDSPTVDKDEIERFSRIAEEWWDENGKFRPLHRMNPVRLGYIRDTAIKHFRRAASMQPLEGLSILDIGCGGGLLCEPLARLGANVTGIDAAEKNIAVASLHAEKMGLEIDYRCAAAEELVTSNEERGTKDTSLAPRYDIVLAMEIVEHVADVPAFLKAVTSLVKPGGLLFMSTMNRSLKAYAMAIIGAEYVLRWLPRGTHEWRKFLKPSELCSGLRNQGLSVNHMTGMVFNPIFGGWSLKDSDLDVNYLLSASKAA